MEMVERNLLNQKWMDEVPRAFAISDIQSSRCRNSSAYINKVAKHEMLPGN